MWTRSTDRPKLARLHAIVDGITVAVCLGRVTAPAGVRIGARHHLARLDAPSSTTG